MNEKLTIKNFTSLGEVIERAGDRIAGGIMPLGVPPGRDAAGVGVGSLTEAVMGVTAGLVQIAEAINNLAAAVRDGREESE